MRPLVSVSTCLIISVGACSSIGSSFEQNLEEVRESLVTPIEDYFAQSVEWSSCGGDAFCAVVRAPLDWDNPGRGGDVALALSMHKSTERSQGSLFVNPGGPGVSGFTFVRDNVEAAVSDDVRASFDVVGWDPRGVNLSSSISCSETDAELDKFFFGQFRSEAGSDERRKEEMSESIRFGEQCLRHSGELLGFVDTLSTVRDLDLLRDLLGNEKLNYFGYSYGTLIGALYIEEYPLRVGRVVLDGPIDPASSQFDLVLNQHRGFERALGAYLNECAVQNSCPFEGNLSTQLQQVSELYEALALNPLPHSDGRLVDDGVLRTAMITALYSADSWPFLDQMFSELRDGETETAFFLVDYYYDRDDGKYLNNSIEAFIAINCLDYAPESDPDVLRSQAAQLRQAAPFTSRPSENGDLVCMNWPYPPKLQRGPVSGEGADPIVILGTTGDPATPYNWAQSLNAQISNSVLVTLIGEGHLAYDEGLTCINRPVDSYLISGELPMEGLTCEMAKVK